MQTSKAASEKEKRQKMTRLIPKAKKFYSGSYPKKRINAHFYGPSVWD